MQFSPQGGNGTVFAPSDTVAGSANFEDMNLQNAFLFYNFIIISLLFNTISPFDASIRRYNFYNTLRTSRNASN